MIKTIKRWWLYHIKTTLYVYVITIDDKVSLVLFDKCEATNYCKRLFEKGHENVGLYETEIV